MTRFTPLAQPSMDAPQFLRQIRANARCLLDAAPQADLPPLPATMQDTLDTLYTSLRTFTPTVASLTSPASDDTAQTWRTEFTTTLLPAYNALNEQLVLEMDGLSKTTRAPLLTLRDGLTDFVTGFQNKAALLTPPRSQGPAHNGLGRFG